MLKSFEISANGSELGAFSELILCALEGFSDYAVISLKGDLAAGKTTLAKAFICALCQEDASSPTYLKMNEYSLAPKAGFEQFASFEKLYHYDFYAASSEQLASELRENLLQDGLHLCEWLDSQSLKMLAGFNIRVLEINISHRSAKSRLYELRWL